MSMVVGYERCLCHSPKVPLSQTAHSSNPRPELPQNPPTLKKCRNPYFAGNWLRENLQNWEGLGGLFGVLAGNFGIWFQWVRVVCMLCAAELSGYGHVLSVLRAAEQSRDEATEADEASNQSSNRELDTCPDRKDGAETCRKPCRP
eukprot:584569-Amphidinium_carterae.1